MISLLNFAARLYAKPSDDDSNNKRRLRPLSNAPMKIEQDEYGSVQYTIKRESDQEDEQKSSFKRIKREPDDDDNKEQSEQESIEPSDDQSTDDDETEEEMDQEMDDSQDDDMHNLSSLHCKQEEQQQQQFDEPYDLDSMRFLDDPTELSNDNNVNHVQRKPRKKSQPKKSQPAQNKKKKRSYIRKTKDSSDRIDTPSQAARKAPFSLQTWKAAQPFDPNMLPRLDMYSINFPPKGFLPTEHLPIFHPYTNVYPLQGQDQDDYFPLLILSQRTQAVKEGWGKQFNIGLVAVGITRQGGKTFGNLCCYLVPSLVQLPAFLQDSNMYLLHKVRAFRYYLLVNRDYYTSFATPPQNCDYIVATPNPKHLLPPTLRRHHAYAGQGGGIGAFSSHHAALNFGFGAAVTNKPGVIGCQAGVNLEYSYCLHWKLRMLADVCADKELMAIDSQAFESARQARNSSNHHNNEAFYPMSQRFEPDPLLSHDSSYFLDERNHKTLEPKIQKLRRQFEEICALYPHLLESLTTPFQMMTRQDIIEKASFK